MSTRRVGVTPDAGLSRTARKFRALETLQVRLVVVAASIDALHLWEPGRYARVNRGWRNCVFLGWYVDSRRPPRIEDDQIVTMTSSLTRW